jgi:hypothetical protein
MSDTEPDVGEIRRQALERLRQLEGKPKGKKKAKRIPSASPELWPGGPGIDTNDIRIARSKRRARIAAIRQEVV